MKTIEPIKHTTLIVSTGQYETTSIQVIVKHKTRSELLRRARQLSREHATYGDNFQGWIYARIAIASDRDEYGDNSIIGGQWCKPFNGFMDLS